MVRSAFEQVLTVQIARYTSPEAAKKRHIEIARQILAKELAGQQIKPAVTIETDGHPAANENSVKPWGVIVYRFRRMREIAAWALAEAERLSPVESGQYKRSWFVMVDGAAVEVAAMPQTAVSFTLTNDQPYARKIEVRGARLRRVPPGIVERIQQSVRRRYRAIIDARVEYVTLAGGHVLKRNAARMQNGRRSVRRTAGRALTYPAVTISAKF